MCVHTCKSSHREIVYLSLDCVYVQRCNEIFLVVASTYHNFMFQSPSECACDVLVINTERVLSMGESRLNLKSKTGQRQVSLLVKACQNSQFCLPGFLCLSVCFFFLFKSQAEAAVSGPHFYDSVVARIPAGSPVPAVRKFKLGQVITRVFTTWRFMHH